MPATASAPELHRARADELHRVEQVVQATLREVLATGGTVAAEHGIGSSYAAIADGGG
jgi:hypothetical protein